MSSYLGLIAFPPNGGNDGRLAFQRAGQSRCLEQGRRRLVAVNYASNQSQCYVRFALPGPGGSSVRFADLLGPTSFVRDGNDLVARGLYLDMPPWGYHVFAMSQ